MNINGKIFSDRKVSFYIWTIAALASLGCAIYYIIQSNIDSCFDIKYFIATVIGILFFLAAAVTRKDLFILLAMAAESAALGFMVYKMMPTMSDVWNGVDYIGGNLTAYIIYTAVTFVAAVVTAYVCFVGTEKK